MSLECIPVVASSARIPEDVTNQCLQVVNSAPVKALLKQNTDEAVQLGAFGSPTIVATIDGQKEMYFGQDRLLLLADHAGKPWLGANPQKTSSKL